MQVVADQHHPDAAVNLNGRKHIQYNNNYRIRQQPIDRTAGVFDSFRMMMKNEINLLTVQGEEKRSIFVCGAHCCRFIACQNQMLDDISHNQISTHTQTNQTKIFNFLKYFFFPLGNDFVFRFN